MINKTIHALWLAAMFIGLGAMIVAGIIGKGPI